MNPKPKAKDWLALVRIQSAPVTVITICVGYLTVTQKLLTPAIVPLVAVAFLSHLGEYGLNDVSDYKHDLENKDSYKPLIDGSVDVHNASFVCIAMICFSIIFAFMYLSFVDGVLIFVANMLSMMYNEYSKEDTYSSLYIATSEAIIVIVGGLYAGGINIITVLVAVIVFIHLVLMTILGDVKDIESDEKSIPHKLDCKMVEVDGRKHIFTSARFVMGVAFPLISLQMVLIGIIPIIWRGFSNDQLVTLVYILLSLILVLFGADYALGSMSTEVYSDSEVKRKITLYEIFTVCGFIIASSVFMGVLNSLLLIVAAVVWGLSWQKIIFSDPLYFA